jgi:ParB family chromosome partitioning protein
MSESTRRILETAIDGLLTEPQVRQAFDEESLQELASSIRSVGILQPLLVQPDVTGRFTVIDGERRLRAAKLAGLKTVPVIARSEPLAEHDVTLRQLIANLHREDLNDDEKAEALGEMKTALNCTAAELATRVGVSASTVSRLLGLLAAPSELRLAVRTGRVPAGSVYEVMKVKDPEQRAAMTTLLLNGELVKADVTRLRKSANAQRTSKDTDAATPVARVTVQVDRDTKVTFASSKTLTAERVLRAIEFVGPHVRKAIAQRLSLTTLSRVMKERVNAAVPVAEADAAPAG